MLRWLTAGESHGPALVAIMEGLPAGVEVTSADLGAALARRLAPEIAPLTGMPRLDRLDAALKSRGH